MNEVGQTKHNEKATNKQSGSGEFSYKKRVKCLGRRINKSDLIEQKKKEVSNSLHSEQVHKDNKFDICMFSSGCKR